MAKSEVWQNLLNRARELKAESSKTIYQRVALLKQVYEDQTFMATMRQHRKNPLEEMNQEVDDAPWGFTFDVLLVLFAKFPQEKDWMRISLREMHRIAVEGSKPTPRRQAAQKAKSGTTNGEQEMEINGNQGPESAGQQATVEEGRERLSWKTKYYELLEKCQDLQRENKALKKEVADLKEVMKAWQPA